MNMNFKASEVDLPRPSEHHGQSVHDCYTREGTSKDRFFAALTLIVVIGVVGVITGFDLINMLIILGVGFAIFFGLGVWAIIDAQNNLRGF